MLIFGASVFAVKAQQNTDTIALTYRSYPHSPSFATRGKWLSVFNAKKIVL